MGRLRLLLTASPGHLLPERRPLRLVAWLSTALLLPSVLGTAAHAVARPRLAGYKGHMAALVVLIALCAVLGYVVARPWVVAVAVGAIIGFYVGLDSGWWGNGTGDGWQFAMLLMVALASVVTVAAVVLGQTRRH